MSNLAKNVLNIKIDLDENECVQCYNLKAFCFDKTNDFVQGYSTGCSFPWFSKIMEFLNTNYSSVLALHLSLINNMKLNFYAFSSFPSFENFFVTLIYFSIYMFSIEFHSLVVYFWKYFFLLLIS